MCVCVCVCVWATSPSGATQHTEVTRSTAGWRWGPFGPNATHLPLTPPAEVASGTQETMHICILLFVYGCSPRSSLPRRHLPCEFAGLPSQVWRIFLALPLENAPQLLQNRKLPARIKT